MAIRGDQSGQDKVAFAARRDASAATSMALGSSLSAALLGGLLLLIGP